MRIAIISVCALAFAASLGDTAWAAVSEADLEALRQEFQAALDEKQTNIDHVWTMLAAALVFLMQGGFLLLEAVEVDMPQPGPWEALIERLVASLAPDLPTTDADRTDTRSTHTTDHRTAQGD